MTGVQTCALPISPLSRAERRDLILRHLEALYAFHGEEAGVRIARKHLGWYARGLPGGESFRQAVVRIDAVAPQRAAVNDYFGRLAA